VSEPAQLLDVEAIADRARVLWRDARDRATTAHVELFAKVAVRARVMRDPSRVSARVDRVFESGLALRAFSARHDHAGFAAASGFSAQVIRWVVDTACAFRAQASVAAPRATDSVADERWDLDASAPLPGEGALTNGLLTRPHLEWVEAGTTVEVLIGTEGWLAARRRHRVWALSEDPEASLVAQRGLEGWERLLDRPSHDSSNSQGFSNDLDVLVFTPDAAAPVVAALVTTFHGPGAAPVSAAGIGWRVSDEPNRHDGLAGGSFDDAGFPTTARALAADGVWVGRLDGPGTFRRNSFREPPTESATNLCVPSGSTEFDRKGIAVVQRCRIFRPSAGIWVMEIDLQHPSGGGGAERRWIRVKPESLLAACAARLGRSTVTSSGPIVPALRLEGLAAD
jgi:hypothetical protein